MTTVYKTNQIAFHDGIPIFTPLDSSEGVSAAAFSPDPDGEKGFAAFGYPVFNEALSTFERSTVKLIRKYLNGSNSILDVQVGRGDLLSHFPGHDLYGMDTRLTDLRIASARGINCCHSHMDDIPYCPESFEVVICVDLLQRVIDLNFACHQLLAVLKTGHHLIIRVPYKEDLGRYLAKEYPVNGVHLRSFDETNLTMLFERIFNCRIIETSMAQGTPPEINMVVKKTPDWDRSPLLSGRPVRQLEITGRQGVGTCSAPILSSRQAIRTLYLEINDKDPDVDRWKPLSYIIDWREAFLGYPDLDVELCNINNDAHYSRCLREIGSYGLIVVSHAATGDDMTRLLASRQHFMGRKGNMAVFIGNEYDILSEKISFIRSTGADFICTQLPLETAEWLYGECTEARIIAMPHALNPRNYYPLRDAGRPIDIGFIGDIYFPWIGDIERTVLIELFRNNGASFGLNCDIRTQRIPLEQWNVFLNNCKGIIGAESGSYYLNGRGDLLRRAKEYMEANPGTTFKQLHAIFFKDQASPVSGKAISSRHFEPIGTKTCQLLLEGDYNGILKAGEHYIPIRKDYSNLTDALGKFMDHDYRRAITERAYEYVMSHHTHNHRIAHMLDQLGR
jgi:SAM-dependent methyltransferase